MSSGIRVKICGLTEPAGLDAAVRSGAAYVGFNFYPKSPRYILPAVARDLALSVPPGVAKVALVVDAEDALLADLTEMVPLDILQLHGTETPERVAEIRKTFGLPVMKVVGVASAEDVAGVDRHQDVADQILVDAKPPRNATLPGGNGLTFDWSLLDGYEWRRPWMLAGGLTPDNVAEAIRRTGARQVDVASGVEIEPGRKDPDLIRAFLRAAV